MDLNGEQEQQMLDRALEEAQKTRGQGARQLSLAGDEARMAQFREAAGGNVATTTVDRTGAYGDYLKLKQKAEGQYQAAVRGQSGVSGMLRRQRAQLSGVNAAWTEQGDMQEEQERRALQTSTRDATDATRMAGEEKAIGIRKAAAEKERKDKEAAEDLANSRGSFESAFSQYERLSRGNTQADLDEAGRYARIVSRGVDSGHKLPGLNSEQRKNFAKSGDMRGFGVERAAWGAGSPEFNIEEARRRYAGKAQTKKGTDY